MSDITTGKGGVESVTATPVIFTISDDHRTANYCKVWNTGASTVYANVNEQVASFVAADAVAIPAEGNFTFLSVAKPIKTLVLATATGETSTANYGAY